MCKRGASCFFCCASAAVGSTAAGKTEPQKQQQLGTVVHPMFATVEIAESIESFDGQSQHGEEPAEQQTVGMMMTDMLQTVTSLGVVEALVLDLPTAFGHAEQSLRAHGGGRKIGQPVGFHHLAVRFVLAIEKHPNGFPAQCIPGVEVLRVPQLHAIRSMLKNHRSRLGRKTLAGGSE